MLNQIFANDPLLLGLAQAAAAILLALVVMLLARHWQIHLEREVIVALARGIIQIVIVGWVLVVLVQGPNWTSALVLLGMIFAAAAISARRAKGIPGAFEVSLWGIGLGAGSVIVLMVVLGLAETGVSELIPVGSMIIANAMNTNALALERFRSEVQSHTGQIEAALALGAAPNATITPYVQAAVTASLIPRIDSLRSLGIVWIPGLMAGMVLAGSNPVYAAIYQFVVIAIIFATSGITSLISVLLIRARAFSAAEQLLLRARET